MNIIAKYGALLIAALVLSNCATFDDYDPLNVSVNGDEIIATGVIDGTTPDILGRAIQNNPEVKTLVLLNVPGSADDVSNLKVARKVRAAGLTTLIPADGMVASGGTDLFLAGAERKIEEGACLGVHSWAGGTIFSLKQGNDFPKDDPEHQKYLTYYTEMGIPTDFYWYTLDAADAENMHWMTDAEIQRYRLGTVISGASQSQPSECEDRIP